MVVIVYPFIFFCRCFWDIFLIFYKTQCYLIIYPFLLLYHVRVQGVTIRALLLSWGRLPLKPVNAPANRKKPLHISLFTTF